MPKHPIVHIEFPAADPGAAGKFYAEAFGWKLEVDPSFDYHMFQAEGGPGGGFVKVSEDTKHETGSVNYKTGEPLIYIQADDIEATLATIESLGGKTLLPKTEIPHTGWWALFSDPAGNRVGLFTGVGQQS